MKKIISILATALCSIYLNAQQFGNFEVSNFNLALGSGSVSFNYYDANWNGLSLKYLGKPMEGFPKYEKGKFYDLQANLFARLDNLGTLSQKFTFSDRNTCRLSATMTPSETAKYNEISYAFSFPISESKLKLDSIAINPEESLKIQKVFSAKRVEVECAYGNVVFEGDLNLLVQDNRIFGGTTYSLRFKPRKEGNTLTWNIKVSFEGPDGSPIYMNKAPAKNLDIPNLPRGTLKLGGVKFAFSNPAGNGLVVEPGKELKLPGKNFSKYLFILGGFASADELSPEEFAEAEISFPNGKKQILKISAENSGAIRDLKSSDNSNVVWTSRVGAKTYNIFGTRLDLEASNATSITIRNHSESDFKIAAATSSPVGISINKIKGKFLTQTKEYFPFDPPRSVVKSSPLDFSWLLDAPAGKYGFAKARGGEIYFENRPDKPVRFYGNNLCFSANYPDKENADKLADAFAAAGYNIMRIHHYDNPLIDKTSPGLLGFDAEKLDRLDYLVAAMKKRGIYITTDLYVSRVLADDAVEKDIGWNKSMTANKAAFFVSRKAVENWQTFSKNLLNHVNPYTGLAWKDDPAIVSISLVNENTIFGSYTSMLPHFERLFNKWLEAKSITPNDKDKSFLRKIFLSEVYGNFYKEQKAFLDSLGVRAMITDQNFWEGYSVTLMRKYYDIIDTHRYYGHPSFIEKPWSLPAKMKNTSSISEYGGCISLSDCQMAGKPFSITEWNYVNNNDHCAEGAFLIGAYGSLHKWDMLCRFAYSHSTVDFSKPASIISYFDANIVSLFSDRAGALFYLREDVKPSDITITSFLPEDYLTRPEPEKNANSPLLKRIGLYAATEVEINPTPSGFKVPQNSPFAVAAEQAVIEQNKFDKPVILDTKANLPQLTKLTGGKLDVENERYESSTSEMVLDKKNETWQLITSKSEAFIGPKGKSFKGAFAEIRNTRGWSSTLISSIDNNPLKDSSKILILHLSDIKNTNMRFDDTDMTILRDHGTTPLLAKKTDIIVKFKNPMEGWKLYALNNDGTRGDEIEMDRTAETASVRLSTVKGRTVIFAYELVKE